MWNMLGFDARDAILLSQYLDPLLNLRDFKLICSTLARRKYYRV